MTNASVIGYTLVIKWEQAGNIPLWTILFCVLSAAALKSLKKHFNLQTGLLKNSNIEKSGHPLHGFFQIKVDL